MCHGLLLDEGGPLGQHRCRQQKVFEADIGTGRQLVRPTAGLKTIQVDGCTTAGTDSRRGRTKHPAPAAAPARLHRCLPNTAAKLSGPLSGLLQ